MRSISKTDGQINSKNACRERRDSTQFSRSDRQPCARPPRCTPAMPACDQAFVVQEIRDRARGRWSEILTMLGGIPSEHLDGKNHPCPRPGCGGRDRFRFSNLNGDGSIICNQCGRNIGDGIGALMWATGQDFQAVVKMLVNFLGLTNGKHHGNDHHLDPLELLARKKHCTVESLKRYGAKVNGPRVDFPVYDASGVQCSTFTIDARSNGKAGKGLFAKGKPAGIFLPHDQDGKPSLPKPGEAWYIVEGVKDAAALEGLGLLAVGLPNCRMNGKFATLFTGVAIVIIPDRDEAGVDGAEISAARLFKCAASVAVAALPVEFKASEGADVRDVLALPDGEKLLRKAIATARPWDAKEPSTGDSGIAPICSSEGCTEAMNARRFAAKFGSDVRYCGPWGKWLTWDGTRWKIDDCLIVDAMGKEIGRELWSDHDRLAPRLDSTTPEGKAALTLMSSWCRASNSDHGLHAMLALARSEPDIPVVPSLLDQDPWLLNVQNGTIDLRTGLLRAHDRGDNITKLAPIEFQESAECTLWCEFLARILPDADLRAFVQRLVGYCLTGATQEHVLPFLFGGGANGKSTFLNVILKLLGPDYAMKAPTDLLLAKKNESHPTELADLHGKRFVACVEAEDGRRLAESLVKELTGGDRIRARRMREDFWEFSATHKIWLAANHKPQVRGTDHGIWRRIKLMPFTVTIPDDRQDKTLPVRLLEELPGILNWALIGCREWQRNGLGEPAVVRAATSEYRSEMDVVGRFIAEDCQLSDGCEVRATELFEKYRAWCDSAGEHPVSQRRFGTELGRREFRNGRISSGPNKGRTCWYGLQLLAQ